jgi:hypothetical protein
MDAIRFKRINLYKHFKNLKEVFSIMLDRRLFFNQVSVSMSALTILKSHGAKNLIVTSVGGEANKLSTRSSINIGPDRDGNVYPRFTGSSVNIRLPDQKWLVHDHHRSPPRQVTPGPQSEVLRCLISSADGASYWHEAQKASFG